MTRPWPPSWSGVLPPLPTNPSRGKPACDAVQCRRGARLKGMSTVRFNLIGHRAAASLSLEEPVGGRDLAETFSARPRATLIQRVLTMPAIRPRRVGMGPRNPTRCKKPGISRHPGAAVFAGAMSKPWGRTGSVTIGLRRATFRSAAAMRPSSGPRCSTALPLGGARIPPNHRPSGIGGTFQNAFSQTDFLTGQREPPRGSAFKCHCNSCLFPGRR